MKKFLAAVLALVLTLGLCACGGITPCEEHTWGQWKTVEEATDYTPAQVERKCEKCGTQEVAYNYSQMFFNYADLLLCLPYFTDAQMLQQNLDSVITAAFFANGVPVQTQQVEYYYQHTIKVSDLDAFTTKVFGCTYDYTDVVNMEVLYESIANYDDDREAILIQAFGAGDQSPEVVDVTYEEMAGGVFMVTATCSFNGQTYDNTFCVVKSGENYIIATY